MAGSGGRGAGGSDPGEEEEEVGEEFDGIDPDVTDEDITDAAEKFIDAMWKRAEDQFQQSRPQGKDRVDPFAEEKWAKIEEGLEEAQDAIRKRFKDLLTPRPSAFKPLIEKTQAVAMALGTADASEYEEGDKVTRLGGNDDFAFTTAAISYLSHWRGDLKYTLVEDYLTPFPGIMATQGSLAKVLRNSARLLQFIFERRRSDAKQLADKATVAVESAGDSAGGVAFMLLGILGAAIPVAGTITSGVIGAMASTASAIGGEFAGEEEEVPLSAGTVQGVVDNLFKALDESDETMREDEEKVLDLLQSLEVFVSPLAAYPDDTKSSELIPLTPEVPFGPEVAEVIQPFG